MHGYVLHSVVISVGTADSTRAVVYNSSTVLECSALGVMYVSFRVRWVFVVWSKSTLSCSSPLLGCSSPTVRADVIVR